MVSCCSSFGPHRETHKALFPTSEHMFISNRNFLLGLDQKGPLPDPSISLSSSVLPQPVAKQSKIYFCLAQRDAMCRCPGMRHPACCACICCTLSLSTFLSQESRTANETLADAVHVREGCALTSRQMKQFTAWATSRASKGIV